ncbi:MAG: M15 family metallopeptidase [Nocardioidaceae bacterium]|nr:M15 family metallopeptidase [Nocardioidaceae bacterium]
MRVRVAVVGVLCAVLVAGGAAGCGLDGESAATGAPTTSRSPSDTPPAPSSGGATRSVPAVDPPMPAPTVTATAADFSGSVSRIGPDLRARMRFAHHRGCPVRLRDLRYVQVSFVGFAGVARSGELVVHESQARPVVRVFRTLYNERFPIRRMRLVDVYQGDDDASMSANNTSAYNCRRTTSGGRWSEHAYGRAIDINPIQNPYLDGSFVAPHEGRRFAGIDRSLDAPYVRGALRSADVVVTAFERIGWLWGGDWTYSKDYQHFSATGR